MAYKARRTRDLQGEVQAGTNISVVETTKPDGTKVYTLSADSGEIPNLEDMSNSIAVYEIGMGSASEDNTAYSFTDNFLEQIESIGDFFIPISTTYLIDNNPLAGLKVLKSGVYKIDVAFQVNISSLTIPENSYLTISVLTVVDQDNFGVVESEKYFYSATDISNEKYICEITINTFIEAEENEAICIVLSTDNPNMDTDISLLGQNPRFSIQKVR